MPFLHDAEAPTPRLPHRPSSRVLRWLPRPALAWPLTPCGAAALCLLLAHGPAVQAAVPARHLASCSWEKPGANPYQGEVAAAVDRYTDIPAATRAALKARMAEQRYDDIAVIGRDHITGRYRYTDLRDMHFGAGRLCKTVTRKRWPEQAQERGLVYCESGHCIIVPTVCRNVSRVTRKGAVAGQAKGAAEGAAEGAPQGAAAGAPGSGEAGRATAAAGLDNGELMFDAPSAGRASGAPGEDMTLAEAEVMSLLGSAPGGALGTPPDSPGLQAGASSSTNPGGGPNAEALPVPAALAGNSLLDLSGSNSFVNTAQGSATGGGGPTANAGPALPLSPFSPGGTLGGGAGVVDLQTAAATTPVPEPASAALMALGLAVLVGHAARRRLRQNPDTQPWAALPKPETVTPQPW